MKKKAKVYPEALLAAAAAGLGVYLLLDFSFGNCENFKGIWSDTSPLHLTEEAQNDANRKANELVREYLISNTPIVRIELQSALAKYMASDCSWSPAPTSGRAMMLWNSFGKIIDWAVENNRPSITG